MKLEYQLTLNDYLEASQGHLKSQSFLLWIFSILFFLIGLLCIIINPADWTGYCLFVGGIFYIPLIKLNQRYQLARLWKSQPNLREPTTLEFNEEGIIYKTFSVESNIKWQLYTKFRETKKLFMLYQFPHVFNILPKRAFMSNEQLDQFRELLRIEGISSR
ncbi:YcxB family protein [Microcoleus sp. Pol11C1]|uniref:YcxB family protein n=1 Tax=unclassified Microcoleus TaxID=2642155 RepID=UPI002FD79B25